MDILKNKTAKSYDYLSRYSTFSIYYHTQDNKFIYEKTAQLSPETSYALVNVTEATTLDGLAFKYYGRPDYYWIIADFNRIQDPFIQLSDYFTKIKVPTITAIEFEA